MGLLTKIKGYGLTSFFSSSKLVSSMGQSYFGLKHVSEYFFKNPKNPAHIIIPLVGIIGNLGVNSVTRVPAIYKKFGPREITDDTPKKTASEPSLGFFGSFFYYSFLLSGHLTNLFNALGGYFGTIQLSEFIANLSNTDAHDQIWKESLLQTAAIAIFIASIATYYVYEHQVIKEHGKRLANKVNQRDFSFDRHTAKTLALSSLNLITIPILSIFWTKPSLLKIPYAHKILGDLGITCLAWINSTANLIANIALMPCMYDSFANNQINNYPSNYLTKSIKYFTIAMGTVDCIAAGFSTFVGITGTAKDILNLNPYGPIIALAAPSGASASVQNAIFSVKPGYTKLLNDLYANDHEISSDEEEQGTLNPTTPFFTGENAHTSLLFKPNSAASITEPRPSGSDQSTSNTALDVCPRRSLTVAALLHS